jgi:hypothetical protein
MLPMAAASEPGYGLPGGPEGRDESWIGGAMANENKSVEEAATADLAG